MFSKKEFAIIVSNLRFINKTNFMLIWVEHEKKFDNLEAWEGNTFMLEWSPF